MPDNTSSLQPLETAAAELSLAMVQLVRRMRTEGNPNELNLSQLGTLARLDRIGPVTPAALARAESMKPQSMGTILAGLEEDGLVQRRPHPTDGRQVLFELTPKGVEERRRRRLAKREWLAAALAQLEPSEQHVLIAAIPFLKRLADSQPRERA